MSKIYSPKIVQDGLVMCLDASQNKSYPTTDLPVKNGLLLWLDAADDTTFSYSSGTEVSQWRDKSGNNFHANQATTAQQPSRNVAVNSRKGVNFTSANGDFMRVSNGIVTPYVTVFAVIRPATQNNEYAIIVDQDHGLGYNGWVIQRNASTSFWQTWVSAGGASTWLNANQIAYTDNTSQIVTLRKNESTLNLFSNASSNGAVSIANTTITQTSYGLNLGRWEAYGGRFYNGTMCEILVFNRGLSDVELKLVNTYLGQKWGVLNTDRNIFDLSGLEDNGVLGDGTTANMPLLDYYNKGSLRFDGTNDYLSVTRTLSVPFTISGFIKYVDQNKTLNTFINGFPHQTIAISLNRNGAGNLQVFLGNGSSWVGAPAISYTSLTVDTWYHITFTCDGTTSRLYLNGVSIGTSSIIPSGFGSYFYLGHLTGGVSSSEYLKGNIAASQLYTTALSAAQVLQNYEAQKSKFEVSLVQQGLILNLDAGNPYSYAGAGSDWFDVSGNNNTSLLVGTTLPTFSNTNGGILIYDGNTQYSRTPSPSNNFAWTPSGVGLNNMTIDLWIKTTDGSGTILSKPWSGNGEYNFGLGHQGFSIVIGNQTNTLGFSSILTGNWINLVIVVSPTQYGAYINGVQNTALTNHGITNNTPTYGNGQIELTLMTLYPYGGGGNAGFSTQGNIGSFRIYNRVLTASEVLQNYNATKGRFGL
jgi:hypothetical protein